MTTYIVTAQVDCADTSDQLRFPTRIEASADILALELMQVPWVLETEDELNGPRTYITDSEEDWLPAK